MRDESGVPTKVARMKSLGLFLVVVVGYVRVTTLPLMYTLYVLPGSFIAAVFASAMLDLKDAANVELAQYTLYLFAAVAAPIGLT